MIYSIPDKYNDHMICFCSFRIHSHMFLSQITAEFPEYSDHMNCCCTVRTNSHVSVSDYS